MPENTSRVPMVCCPKCGHLLPELPRNSVYRCGGCGGVLRAEKGSSVMTDDQSDRGLGVDLARHSEGRTTRRVSKSPVKSRYRDATRKSPMRERNLGGSDGQNKSPIRGGASKSPLRSRYGDGRKSPLRRHAMRDNVVANFDQIQAKEKVGAWVEDVKDEVGYVNKLVLPTESFSGWLPGEPATDQNQIELNKPSASPRKRRTWRTDDGFDLKEIQEQVSGITDQIDEDYANFYGTRHREVSHDGLVEEDDYGRGRRSTDMRFQDGYVQVFERPRGRMEQWEAQRIGFRGAHGNDRPPGALKRVPIDSYEPLSNYHSGSYYVYEDELQSYRSRSHFNGSSNHQNVAIKQADLLRKYNELGEQLHRIDDFYGDPDNYEHNEFLRVRRGTVQSSGPNGSPRMRHNYNTGPPDPGPAGRHHEEDINNFLPLTFVSNEYPFYDDPSSPRILQRTPHHELHHYQQQVAPRRPMDSTYKPRAENLHHLTRKHNPVAVNDYKTHPIPHTQSHQYQDYPNACGERTALSKSRNPTPNNLSSNSRSSVESKSGGGSLVHGGAKRVLVVGQNQQLCHPVAGGAPFLTCSKCSQLLRLPRKLEAMMKNQCRLQCGSCHTILSFNFDKKKSHASVEANLKPDDKNSHHNYAAGMAQRESFDLKSTVYTFQTSDSEPSIELLEDRKLNSSEAKMKPGLSPSSSQASKDDKLLEAVGQTDASSSKVEEPLPNSKLPLRPPPGSPLRYHLDYSDMLAAKESQIKETVTSSHGKGAAERDSSSLDYEENAAATFKLDLNSHQILRTDASRGSLDPFVRKDQGGVFVNGQPIALDALRSAEKMAGPISPGEYWYDPRAGFWGLIGGHCLGIIAPFIKEFRAPMPENCSDGDTCIYVNGREVHKNDLDLLSSRGLPRTRYKYYVVDLSGKVEDEDTGRFVVNLGKLAPNVERTGRGFGMQPPEIDG